MFPLWLHRLTKREANSFPFLFDTAVGDRHPCPGWQLPHSSTGSQPWGAQLPCSLVPTSASSSHCRQGCREMHLLVFHFSLWPSVAHFKPFLFPALAESSWLQLGTRVLFLGMPSLPARDKLPGTSAGGLELLLVFTLPAPPSIREATQLVLTASPVKSIKCNTETAQTTVL